MSGILRTTVGLDAHTRESVTKQIEKALVDLEEKAHSRDERIVWDSISFKSDTDYEDDLSFAESVFRRQKLRSLDIIVRTVELGVDL